VGIIACKILLTGYHNQHYCFTNSTLLFFAFPKAVLLLSTGADSPLPSVVILEAAIPNSFDRAAFTASALFLERVFGSFFRKG